MQGAVLDGPRDVRFEERPAPTIVEPTDAIIRLSATCICGSDLWPYRGVNPITEPTPMGHEYCGIVEEVGRGATSIKKGQFVIGSCFASDNTCPHQGTYQRHRRRRGPRMRWHAGSDDASDRYLPDLIDRVLKGQMNPGKVFDLTLPLHEVAEGYRAMDERRAIKTLLRPQGD